MLLMMMGIPQVTINPIGESSSQLVAVVKVREEEDLITLPEYPTLVRSSNR